MTCAFAIHCCLVRRELVVAAGGFDESLTTCEDWDLWLRLARMGARFRAIPERLALYHVHPGTASLDGRRMLVDGLEVLGRAHAPDPRVGRPDPRFAEGRDRRLLVPTRMACACFAAGLALGAGHDARPLLDELGDDRCSKLDPVTVAWCIYAAAPLAGAYSPDRWEELWPLVEQGLDPFLEQLERRTSPGLAHRARHELERLVLARSGAPLPLAIGSRLAVGIELTEPLEGVSVEPSVERLLCRVEHDGQPLGSVELPVCDGEVPADVLADSLAAELFWPLLGRFFSLEPVEHDRDGWATFLRELWGKPGWDEDRFYEAAATNGAPGQLRPTRGRVRLEVSEPLPDLRTRGRLLLVDVTVGGAPVGVVRLRPGRGGVVRAQELRAAITAGCGLELAVTAVREVLIGRPLPVGRAAARAAPGGGQAGARDAAARRGPPGRHARLAALARTGSRPRVAPRGPAGRCGPGTRGRARGALARALRTRGRDCRAHAPAAAAPPARPRAAVERRDHQPPADPHVPPHRRRRSGRAVAVPRRAGRLRAAARAPAPWRATAR